MRIFWIEVLYTGSANSFEKETIELSASAPMVYKKPAPMGPKITHHWCWGGCQSGHGAMAALHSASGSGVQNSIFHIQSAVLNQSVPALSSHKGGDSYLAREPVYIPHLKFLQNKVRMHNGSWARGGL